jgi:hypothetical protein
MNLQEKMNELVLRKSQARFDRETEDLCFEIISEHPDAVERCRAAVILSGFVRRGLGSRTREFLQTHPNLPIRVRELLSSSILRMEGF